jgi:DNA-binding CsgD family transcriptional regulator
MPSWNEADLLTPHEQEILELLASGKATMETAERLGVRPSAINRHVLSVCGKTGAQNSAQAGQLYRDHHSRPRAA